MKLIDFLLNKTNARELCVVRIGGWVYATFWIDHEDLFGRYVGRELGESIVKKDSWDYLPVVNENNATVKIPCHYIDI